MSLTVDTSVVPMGERFDYWSSAASDVIHPMVLDRDDRRRFSGLMHISRAGAVDVFHIAGDALTVSRTTELIRAHDPEQLNLVDVLRGSCRVHQDGRRAVIGPGGMSAHCTSKPYTFCNDTPFELLIFGIPRSLLGPCADRIFAATATAVNDRAGEMGRLGQDFLRNLAAGLESGRLDPHAPGLAECVAGLTRGLYTHVDPEPLGDHFEDLYPRLLMHIESRLGDPELGAGEIARAHFISVRRLQKIFHQHGTTVTRYILAERLERCRRALASPSRRDHSIGQIARQWGMCDLPNFSRRFRAEFGMSPSDYRRMHGTG